MTKLKFNDCIFDIDSRYNNIPFGTFTFYVKKNSTLNMLKSCHNKVNSCEFIYPSGKVEKRNVLFKDFRTVPYNNCGYIAQIVAIKQ